MLSQVDATKTDIIGALNTLQVAVQEARASLRTVTRNAAKTRICIAPLTTIPGGSRTVRFGAALMSPQAQNLFGFAGTATTDSYVAFEVQTNDSGATVKFNPTLILNNLDIILKEVHVMPSPFSAACEVGIVRADDVVFGSMLKCACSTGVGNCSYTAPDVLGAPASTPVNPGPTGFTYAPGTWSGAACVPKVCVGRFKTVLNAGKQVAEDDTWPAACPK